MCRGGSKWQDDLDGLDEDSDGDGARKGGRLSLGTCQLEAEPRQLYSSDTGPRRAHSVDPPSVDSPQGIRYAYARQACQCITSTLDETGKFVTISFIIRRSKN